MYVGIDVHRYTHTAVAANRFEEEAGNLTFANTQEGVNSFISWLAGIAPSDKTRIIGIEGTNGNGKLLTRALIKKYEEVYEINPVYTKQRRDRGTRGDKSDAVDARLMIEVLTRKLHELPKVTKQDHSRHMQALSGLVSFHDNLVISKSRLKNQLHKLFYEIDADSENSRSGAFSKKQIKRWLKKTEKHQAEIDNEVKRTITRSKIQEFLELKKTQEKIDKQIKALLPSLNCNLISLPGAGLITAAKIVSTVRGVERFHNIHQFVKYAGIAPVERQSGKTKKHKQAKGGNRQLNNAIYTVALTQMRLNSKAKNYFQKKISEGKTKKHALRCLMKRVACIVYGMMKSGEDYRGKENTDTKVNRDP